MKINYAIIKCKENKLDFDYTEDLVNKGIKKEDIQEYEYDETKTLAYVKNQAIKYARKKKYNFIFLIEDDVLIKDINIFQKYIDLMFKYHIGVVYYGYYSNMNRVLENIPNPAVKVKIDNEQQMLLRVSNDSFIGIDLLRNTQLFDETFKMLEFNEYLRRCFEYKIIPFQGFYFEVEDSYKYFEYVNGHPVPKKNFNKENIESDKKYIDSDREHLTITYDSDASIILKYIKEIRG